MGPAANEAHEHPQQTQCADREGKQAETCDGEPENKVENGRKGPGCSPEPFRALACDDTRYPADQPDSQSYPTEYGEQRLDCLPRGPRGDPTGAGHQHGDYADNLGAYPQRLQLRLERHSVTPHRPRRARAVRGRARDGQAYDCFSPNRPSGRGTVLRGPSSSRSTEYCG